MKENHIGTNHSYKRNGMQKKPIQKRRQVSGAEK